MVSLRCKMIVKSVLHDMNLHVSSIELGEVVINEEELEASQYRDLRKELIKFGFELLEDKKMIIIEKIKIIIIEMIHYSEEPPVLNFSNYLSQKLNYDYNYLSSLFSEVKGTTIEQYIISHKIERAKELIVYNQLTLTENC